MNKSDVLRAQVRRITSSEGFPGGRRLGALLTYLAETQISKPGSRTTAQMVARDVLGRGTDFDATTDAMVRVTAGQLRRALDFYYAAEGTRDQLRISLPRGGYDLRIDSVPSLFARPDQDALTITLAPPTALGADPRLTPIRDAVMIETVRQLAGLKGVLMTPPPAMPVQDIPALAESTRAQFIATGNFLAVTDRVKLLTFVYAVRPHGLEQVSACRLEADMAEGNGLVMKLATGWRAMIAEQLVPSQRPKRAS